MMRRSLSARTPCKFSTINQTPMTEESKKRTRTTECRFRKPIAKNCRDIFTKANPLYDPQAKKWYRVSTKSRNGEVYRYYWKPVKGEATVSVRKDDKLRSKIGDIRMKNGREYKKVGRGQWKLVRKVLSAEEKQRRARKAAKTRAQRRATMPWVMTEKQAKRAAWAKLPPEEKKAKKAERARLTTSKLSAEDRKRRAKKAAKTRLRPDSTLLTMPSPTSM